MLTAALLVSAGMVTATIVIQIAGLAVLIWVMRWRAGRYEGLTHVLQQLGVILAVVMGLFVVHALQIWLYAGLYLMLDAFQDFETALYFSTASFTTVGYGEIYMAPPWRIVSGIQSANGFLLLGWSTVFLISVLSRLRSVEIDWLERRIDPDLFNRDGDRGER
jgi:hypothetical protein